LFRDIPKSLALLYQAIKADRSNGVRTLRYLFRLADQVAAAILKRYLPDWFYQGLRARKRQIVEKLFRGSLAQQKGA